MPLTVDQLRPSVTPLAVKVSAPMTPLSRGEPAVVEAAVPEEPAGDAADPELGAGQAVEAERGGEAGACAVEVADGHGTVGVDLTP